MAGETILVLDAEPEIDEKIATILEAKGYMVFTASSRVVNAENLEKLGPSLIFIKPSSPSAAGLEPCRTIHNLPSLEHIPIVLLASLKGPRDPRYGSVYGIVDFLKLNFDPDELIEKTEAILGKTSASELSEETGEIEEEPKREPPPTLNASDRADDSTLTEEEFAELIASEERVPKPPSEPWSEEEIEEEKEPTEKPPSSIPPRPGKRRRSALFRPLMGGVIVLFIAGAAFLAYQFLMPGRQTLPVRSVARPSAAPPKIRDVKPKPQLPKKEEPKPELKPSSPQPAIPSPPAEPLAQPPAKPFYSVQIGAFKNEGTAHALEKEFREKGYDAFTQPGTTKEGSAVQRVLVGKYEDRKAAEKLAEEIQSKERIKTVLYAEKR